MRLMPISSNGAGPTFFGFAADQNRSFQTAMRGNARFKLGATPEQWYQRAKVAVANFDTLFERLKRIAGPVERNRILAWVGTASTDGTPAERYASVKSDLAQDVEAFTPPNVNAYQIDRRTNRIEKLEAFNSQFSELLSTAERNFGTLPDPVVIDRTVLQPAKTNWTLPLLVGGGAVAVAIAVSLLSKK